MKQHELALGLTGKRTSRREFLDEMERVAPWSDSVTLVSPYLPESKRGGPLFAPEVMPDALCKPSRLRINGVHTCTRLA